MSDCNLFLSVYTSHNVEFLSSTLSLTRTQPTDLFQRISFSTNSTLDSSILHQSVIVPVPSTNVLRPLVINVIDLIRTHTSHTLIQLITPLQRSLSLVVHTDRTLRHTTHAL